MMQTTSADQSLRRLSAVPIASTPSSLSAPHAVCGTSQCVRDRNRGACASRLHLTGFSSNDLPRTVVGLCVARLGPRVDAWMQSAGNVEPVLTHVKQPAHGSALRGSDVGILLRHRHWVPTIPRTYPGNALSKWSTDPSVSLREHPGLPEVQGVQCDRHGQRKAVPPAHRIWPRSVEKIATIALRAGPANIWRLRTHVILATWS